jgi:hypothetical protein
VSTYTHPSTIPLNWCAQEPLGGGGGEIGSLGLGCGLSGSGIREFASVEEDGGARGHGNRKVRKPLNHKP